ncbi:MAG: hypothetical protein LBI42_05235 [Chitinispirillales bacterium]|jgi:hypothetical protein|nr:hypothetical protein [Chitinispirillales bacterium]
MIKEINSSPLFTNAGQASGLTRAVVVRELDQGNSFVLRTENGREFSVKTEANAGLSVGQNVLISPSEGKIVLIPDNITPRDAQLLKLLPSSDLFSPSGQPSQDKDGAKETVNQNGQKSAYFVVSPEKIFADGLYAVNTAKNTELADKVLRELSGEVKDYVAVRLSSSNEQQVVTAVTRENLQKVIEEIHNGFTGNFMRSLPPAILEQLFTERGEINLDVLKALDSLLQNRNIPVDAASQIQLEKLNQWIRLILDNPQLMEKLAQRVPAAGTQDLIRQIELLGRMSAGFPPEMSGQGQPLTAETFFLTEDKLFADNLSRSALIENLCTSAFSGVPLKLLDILGKLDSPVSSPNPQLPPGEARQLLNEFLNKFPTLAYKELEIVHDSKLFSPKTLDADIPPRQESPKQTAAVTMIRTAFTELAEAAIKALLDGNSKETAAVINAKTALLREIIGQAQSPEALSGKVRADIPQKAVFNEIKANVLNAANAAGNDLKSAQQIIQSEIRTDLLNKSNNPGNVLNSIQNKQVNPIEIKADTHTLNKPDSPENRLIATQNKTTPPDVLIRADFLMKIADNLEKTASSILSGHYREELDSGQKARLMSIVQTAVASAHEMLRSETQTYPVSENFYNRLISMPKLQSGVEEANAVFSRITAAQELIQQLIRDAGALDDKTGAKEVLNLANRMWGEIEKLRSGFQEAFFSLDLQSRLSSLGSTSSSGQSPFLTTAQSIESLRLDLMMNVSKALQDVFSSVKELCTAASQLTDNLRMLPGVEKILRAVAETLEQQTRQSSEELTAKLKNVLKELTHLQAENARTIQQQAQQSSANIKPGSVQNSEQPQQNNPQSIFGDSIKTAIQSAARGLETLQLLAAQTRGGDIQQQIVALPVKIGQEWTEVHVKFLKDRSGAKKRSNTGHVSVYLNVAPSALGEVGAHLDFHPPANLKLSFQFERTNTKKWFMNQSANIREALAEVGLPGAVLEFRSKRAQQTADDVVLTAESGKGKGHGRSKDGKIDFEA